MDKFGASLIIMSTPHGSVRTSPRFNPLGSMRPPLGEATTTSACFTTWSSGAYCSLVKVVKKPLSKPSSRALRPMVGRPKILSPSASTCQKATLPGSVISCRMLKSGSVAFCVGSETPVYGAATTRYSTLIFLREVALEF